VPSAVIASDNDPWMSVASSRRWAQRWGSAWMTLGDAGHINAESGFGPLPLALMVAKYSNQFLLRHLSGKLSKIW
jgi:predicted alpha/beta hydrolase family esterase